MSYSGGIIRGGGSYGGVSINDVRQALSDGSCDLGTLCTSSKINKWAKYKPIRVAGIIRRLTYTEIANAKFGLVPILNTTLYKKSDTSDSGASVVASAEELESVLSSNQQWTYNQPRGKSNKEPYRLTDWAQPADNDSGYGYYHLTPPPIENVGPMSVNLSLIKSCAENTAISSASGSHLYDWQLNDNNNTSPLYSNLAFRFGEATQYNVNGADTRAISLHEILGMTNSEYWRLAVATQVPIGSSLSYMRLFTSKYTFYDTQGVSDTTKRAQCLMPSMGTNQYLCQMIVNYANYLYNNNVSSDVIGNKRLTVTDPTFKLPAILCVVKNMYMDGISRSGSSTPYTHCHLKSESSVYSAPAIISRFEIVVTDDVHYSSSETQAYSLISISTVGTGTYAQFGEATYTRVYINQLVMKQLKHVSSDTTVYYKVTYSYVTGFNGSTPIVASNTINGSVTLTSETDSYEISLAGGPGLGITSKQQSMTYIN